MRYFRVKLSGTGGEIVFGTLTKEQASYWRKNSDFETYLYDRSSYEKVLPESAMIEQQWRDNDDIVHETGIAIEEAEIEIDEVDSEEPDADTVKSIIYQDLRKFLIDKRKGARIERMPTTKNHKGQNPLRDAG
jgi:hypothetical protein